jgi:hypothetical protein
MRKKRRTWPLVGEQPAPSVRRTTHVFARALRDKGVPVPEIARKMAIKSGKNAGKNPSVASLYRALGEADPAGEETAVIV